MTYFNFNEGWWRLPESGIVREACRLATDGATRRMDGRKSLLNREGNGNICFLCMNLQKRTCLIRLGTRRDRSIRDSNQEVPEYENTGIRKGNENGEDEAS